MAETTWEGLWAEVLETQRKCRLSGGINPSNPATATSQSQWWCVHSSGGWSVVHSSSSDRMDTLIDQVGRLTEGVTKIKALVERVANTTERQAAVAEKQAISVERLTQIVENLLQRQP